MVVQHNLSAMNANRYYGINNSKLSKSLEKLSSGYKINRAGDDAAGLAVSEKMRSQIAGMTQGVKNAQDGISMVQTFEGALTETDSILQRMKTLADQSANGTYSDAVDREAIQLEFDQLNDELNQIADTDFNGVICLNGGTMADGLKAENNEFNYGNLAKQQAEALKAAPVDLVAKKDYSTKAPDIQDSKYVASDPTDKTAVGAGKLWEQAKTDGYKAAEDSTTINIKYTVSTVDDDGNVTAYTASYVDDNGNTVGTYGGTVTATKNGGFQDAVTGVNVVTDTIGAKAGDFVMVKYTKPDAEPQAPTNAGSTDMYEEGTGISLTTKSTDANNADIINNNFLDAVSNGFAVAFDTNVATKWTDATDGATYQKAVELLDGAKLTVQWADTATKGGDLAAPVLKLVDSEGNTTNLDTAHAATDAGWAVDKAPAAKDTSVILYYKNVKIGTITFGDPKATGLSTDTVAVTANIAVDGYRLSTDDKPNAALIKDPTTVEDNSVSESNAYGHAAIPLTYTEDITLQTGARSKDAVRFTFKYTSEGIGKLKDNMDCSAREGGLNTANLSLRTADDANAAIDQIDWAINKVSMVRGTFGAIQNRLEHKIDNLNVSIENLTDAESQIRDTDMSTEMMEFTKNQILAQASQSMLAQANTLPQNVLSLLQ